MYTESFHRAVITALVLKACHRRLHSQIILHATTCPFYHFKGATEGKRRFDISISCLFHQSWLQPPKTILQGNYSKPSFNLGLMNRGHGQADLSLSLTFHLKLERSLPMGLLTDHTIFVVHPSFLVSQLKCIPLLKNDWLCLFAIKVNITQEYTSRRV